MKGIYLLIIEIKNDSIFQIGKLGNIRFYKGFYVYVGSALNGLEQRILRHLRQQKKLHWHIDYVLKKANIIEVFYKESNVKEECVIAEILDEKLSSVPDLGCSDCSCKSHLFYGSYDEIMNIIDSLKMKQFVINAKY